jgi:hypothetical protein
VPVILIDANIEGHGERIWNRMRSSEWRTLTADLDVSCKLFRDHGLDVEAKDDVVWRFCQAHGFYLLTSNRNQESEDSLEATIRREWTPTSLPVFTLPLPDRANTSLEFLDRVVEKLLDYVMDADNIRGTVRLWVPGLPE